MTTLGVLACVQQGVSRPTREGQGQEEGAALVARRRLRPAECSAVLTHMRVGRGVCAMGAQQQSERECTRLQHERVGAVTLGPEPTWKTLIVLSSSKPRPSCCAAASCSEATCAAKRSRGGATARTDGCRMGLGETQRLQAKSQALV